MTTERQTQPTNSDPERQRRAPDATEDVVAQSVPAAPLSPGYAPPDPTNPTTLQLRRANITQMQRSLGNAHIARKLAQREDAPAAPAAPSSTAAPAASGLIVDDAADIQPGQMSKSAFLAQLRGEVEATAAAELAGSPLLSEARSQIDQQFAQYSALSGPALEQAIKREVPAAAGATSAQGYIAPICARVRTTIAEQRAALPPGAETVAGVASGIADAASSVADAAAGALSSIGSIFFKAREGGAQAPDDPRAIQAQLGTGHALDSRVQSGLESALGQNFSDVRVHSDSRAGALSDQMNARAFTVGQDIAFSSGEYQPGTLIGDALIAHEVAHVAQQSGATPAAVQQKGEGDYSALEADADQSAVGAVAAMWGGIKGGLAKIGQNALPQLKSGLRLQKCAGTTPKVQEPTATAATSPDTIIGAAQDKSRPNAERAVESVWSILRQYYASDVAKVKDVRYDASLEGLLTTSVGRGAAATGIITVGDDFVQNITKRHISHRILQVGHELKHIDQYRAGMAGHNKQHEREFLAYYWEGLADEPAGTRPMQPDTRRKIIDAALMHYDRLTEAQQQQYQAHKQRLLDRRQREN